MSGGLNQFAFGLTCQFWPLAMLAVLSFCILCSENFGATDLSGAVGDILAWTFVITGLLSCCMAGPSLQQTDW